MKLLTYRCLPIVPRGQGSNTRTSAPSRDLADGTGTIFIYTKMKKYFSHASHKVKLYTLQNKHLKIGKKYIYKIPQYLY